MSYSVLALIGVVVAVAVDLGITRTRLVLRRAFWTSYAIIIGFQLLVNGVLTGLPIVRYRASDTIGWRIAYAPVEDVLFGFALVLLTLAVWVALGRRASQAEANPRPPTQIR